MHAHRRARAAGAAVGPDRIPAMLSAITLLFSTSTSLVVPPPVGARSVGTLTVSEAGLGTLNLKLDKTEEDPDAADALAAAIKAGCNFVDTAEAYGFGNSEKLTAWAAKQAGLSIGTGGIL